MECLVAGCLACSQEVQGLRLKVQDRVRAQAYLKGRVHSGLKQGLLTCKYFGGWVSANLPENELN